MGSFKDAFQRLMGQAGGEGPAEVTQPRQTEETADLDALVNAPPPPAQPSPREQPRASAASMRADERQLQQSHHLLCVLMDSLPDAIYFKDLKSRFIMISRALGQKHFRLANPAQAVGKTDFDFFTEEHARQAYQDEQKIISTGKPLIGIEEKETYPDGHVTWALTSKAPLLDDDGKIIGTFGISRDITDRKRAEEELRSSNEQLRQAQKMEAFGQLAGGIAHDFNNTLGAIMGTAQLLERKYGASDPRLRDNLGMIIDTAKRAGDLTAQLLAFARRGTFNLAPVSMHDIIHSVVNLLEHILDKKIKIVERLYAADASVLGDYAQLQNALLNLAVNSRDAMPNGGALTFATEVAGPEGAPSADRKAGPGRYLRVVVSDTGIGMDSETKARAFEPFFTTKPTGKGTGLGLASVYGTIKSHNGLIEVSSEVNKGTTFTLYFPLGAKAPEQKAPDQPDVIRKGAGRVLIIDDEEVIRKVVTAMLKEMGYTCAACAGGAEGVEYYGAHRGEIDMVIVDMMMPGMAGYECVNALKKVNPDVKVVISTGYSLASDTQKIIAKGIAGFIQKPFHIAELSQLVSEVIHGS